MHRSRLFLFLLLLMAWVPLATKGPEPDRVEVFRQINQEVKEHGQAYQTLGDATSTIGHRMTGTDNGHRAEKYAYDLLKKYGYRNVDFQEFGAEVWQRGEVSLNIVPAHSDNFVTMKAVTLAHSPIQSNVKAPLLDLGNGLARDFEHHAAEVKGKIAVMNLGLVPQTPADSLLKNLHRSEKTALAIQYGAAGVILINQVAGNVLLTGTASVDGALIPLPAVCISSESGKQLRDWMKEEALEGHLQMRNTSDQVQARNVIATLEGKELPDERIIIGGHLDSWDLATGALDNGIGSFTVLEIARVFRELKLKPKRTIQFALFMGEEIGLFGSHAMLHELKETGDLDNVRYMINLDMAGNPVGFNTYGRDEALAFFQSVGEDIRKVEPEFANRLMSRPGLHSDHQGFMLEGIPVASPISNLNPALYDCYHADCDDFDLINRADIENSARYTAMLLWALANADTIPAARLSTEDTRDFLVKHHLKEPLQLGKEWRWGE
ncbi:PA domain-containing protein [Catalinimonas alkaloidigena]|uniref:Carboxypeptidase Q n=1 Tax=Catalinimonas alkaloidigena TaxID=1075417 RepID=A0A1G9E069_9BACT|nr:M28 family peptidase [Catalinimonas alkaloidigena]SDK69504.1 PA domain-containing protein [Catalinimonas alkaloidigena]